MIEYIYYSPKTKSSRTEVKDLLEKTDKEIVYIYQDNAYALNNAQAVKIFDCNPCDVVEDTLSVNMKFVSLK